MSKELKQRNEIILQLKEKGQSDKEIAHRFMITTQRVRDICKRQIQIRDHGLRERQEAYKEERKAWREAWKKEQAEGTKDCVIRNGGADVFLTAIERVDGHPIIYRYGTRDVNEAMRFTRETAEEIAKKRKAVVCILR